MAEKDSAENGGTQGSQPEGSGSQSGQPDSSRQDYITVEQFKQWQIEQQQLLERTLQSDKDRAVKKTNQRLEKVENLVEFLQSAQTQGKSVDDLLAEAQKSDQDALQQDIRTIAEAFRTGKFPSGTGGAAQPGAVDVAEIVKTLELPADDLRVKEFATRQFASKEVALVEGAKLIKTLQKQPTDADKPSGEQSRQQTPSRIKELQAEYEEKSKNLRGQALINLKMAMRKKGLDIS